MRLAEGWKIRKGLAWRYERGQPVEAHDHRLGDLIVVYKRPGFVQWLWARVPEFRHGMPQETRSCR